jgi:hypothetical protein
MSTRVRVTYEQFEEMGRRVAGAKSSCPGPPEAEVTDYPSTVHSGGIRSGPRTLPSNPSNQAALDPRQSPASHRVEVNGLDHGPEGPRCDEVAVPAAAGLPEGPLHPWSATLRDPGEPLGSVTGDEPGGATPDGSLDSTPDRGHLGDRPTWADDEVDVIGPEPERPQGDVPFRPRRVDGLRQPEARPFGREEPGLARATEGQLVSLPRLIVGPALAMLWTHGSTPAGAPSPANPWAIEPGHEDFAPATHPARARQHPEPDENGWVHARMRNPAHLGARRIPTLPRMTP